MLLREQRRELAIQKERDIYQRVQHVVDERSKAASNCTRRCHATSYITHFEKQKLRSNVNATSVEYEVGLDLVTILSRPRPKAKGLGSCYHHSRPHLGLFRHSKHTLHCRVGQLFHTLQARVARDDRGDLFPLRLGDAFRDLPHDQLLHQFVPLLSRLQVVSQRVVRSLQHLEELPNLVQLQEKRHIWMIVFIFYSLFLLLMRGPFYE
jgi:hypothetical protein